MEKRLMFREDGTFRIMQLTDMHYTDDDDDDRRTVEMARRLIAQEKPDLIVVTGDLVYGTDNYRNLDKAAAPMAESGIPWTFVFGNHDVEQHGDRKTMFSMLQAMPGFVGENDPEAQDGWGNHMLPVYDGNGVLRWAVAGIDSGADNPRREVGGYAFVPRRQQIWYEGALRKLEKQAEAFSVLAFQHIAVPEISDLWNYGTCYGVKREGFGSPIVNSGQFLSLLEDGHTKGLFFGHDHLNSFYGSYFGLVLGFGRASGYGGYGEADFPKGARLFTLRRDDLEHFETWEVLEDGRELKKVRKYDPLHRRDEA